MLPRPRCLCRVAVNGYRTIPILHKVKYGGLMWNCVLVGMAQTKQVVRVGRRA